MNFYVMKICEFKKIFNQLEFIIFYKDKIMSNYCYFKDNFFVIFYGIY